jgi:16S rRNA (uracil1498-N3)-methyltransferase
MQVFYAPEIYGNDYTLNETESKHCVKVLRLAAGVPVKLIDGKGNLYEGVIADPNPKKCLITITNVLNDFEKRDYKLHIAISPLKNSERFEWFVEKSVEIGIGEITPLVCHRTEKQSIKIERIEKIIISAMKQSLKAVDTILNPPRSFNEFISELPNNSVKMIAHCNESFNNRVSVSQVCKKGDDAIILIGPEGDFTEDEIEAAIQRNFVPVHLGKSRLRTETAGIVACHSVYFININ